MSEDQALPNKAVAVLIVAALIVTIIGTWTVLKEVKSLSPMTVTTIERQTGANVAMQVMNVGSKESSGSGDVTINILG